METLEEQTDKSVHDSDLAAWAKSRAELLRKGVTLDLEERQQIANELTDMAGILGGN